MHEGASIKVCSKMHECSQQSPFPVPVIGVDTCTIMHKTKEKRKGVIDVL
jgi:hypothetical protein